MRTVHRLVVIIAVVTSSLYAVKHVAAAEVDIVILRASCVLGKVVLDFRVTNNSSMSVTGSFPPILPPITVAAGATQTGRVDTSLASLPSLTYAVPYTRQDGTMGTTPVAVPATDCSRTTATPRRIYLPLIYR